MFEKLPMEVQVWGGKAKDIAVVMTAGFFAPLPQGPLGPP